jgi:hypothetical protein
MSEPVNLLLTDKNIYPSDEYISAIIGEKMSLWQNIMSHMAENYKDSAGEWRFYNDGKRWLFKMVLKKKTVFWAGLINDTFRITFYFGNKADSIIENSDLPLNVKEGFKTAQSYGQIRPVTFTINSNSDVENVYKTIALKSKIK